MHSTTLIPWLNPDTIIHATGPWALLVVCAIVFAETGLLVGFVLPGDTLLVIAGLLTNTSGVFGLPIAAVAALIALAAFAGGEVGYLIGRTGGPTVFERKDAGLFSRRNVDRTDAFFRRYGGLTVILARFVPVVRTFAPVAAGIGRMPWRRYSLFNLVGAVLWGFGLTMFGFGIGYIPWVAAFVSRYIELILLGVVLLSAGGTAWHYLRERGRARREAQRAEPS